MKRSEINAVINEATTAFARHGWAMPPHPRWDVTDFGLGDFNTCGLTLVNLAEQSEYCEKIMYVRQGQVTPCHCHAQKKEDIICRFGELTVEISSNKANVLMQINGEECSIRSGEAFHLQAGERITMTPGIKHSFWASSPYAIVGEVSTANDDSSDNYFEDDNVGRFSKIEEDEPPLVKLVSD